MNRQVLAPLARLAAVVVVAGLGLAVALGFRVHGFEQSGRYLGIATGLLCFGLCMAGLSIDILEAKRHWRIVIIAITVGVVAKYTVIAGIAYGLTGDWRYAVIGMAVAQIDPLSVAALQQNKRLSKRTRTVLNLWASYDDPMTALAAPVLMAIFANTHQVHLSGNASLHHALFSLAPFVLVALVTAAAVLWRRTSVRSLPSSVLLRELRQELHDNKAEVRGMAALGAVATAINWRNAPLAALSALFFRPKVLRGKLGELLTTAALYAATFMLGIVLSGGVDLKGGLILGFATYGSQIVVAWLVVGLSLWLAPADTNADQRFSVREVWHLALAQQNGITAIVLALVLQPSIGIAVASISLAIMVVNLLHFSVNEFFDRVVEPRAWPQSDSEPPEPAEGLTVTAD